MATDVITAEISLARTLDTELENARATLRGVEDNIKRVFGKDASELNTFQRYDCINKDMFLIMWSMSLTRFDFCSPSRRSIDGGGRVVYEVAVPSEEYTDTRGFRGRDQRDNLLRRRDNDNFGGRDDEPIDSKRRRFDDFSVTVKHNMPIVLTSRLVKPKIEDEDYGSVEQFNGGRHRDHEREPQRVMHSSSFHNF